MPDRFKHTLPMSQETKNEILTSEDTLIIFDTNIWLSLYELDHSTRDTFLDLIQKPKILNRLWIPHQVAKEFYDQYVYMIRTQQNIINEFNGMIDNSLDSLISNVQKKNLQNHPFINKSKLVSSVKRYKNQLKKQVQQGSEAYPSSIDDDFLITKIHGIIQGKIGDDFTKDTEDQRVKDGEERYKKRTPPGYLDDSKHPIKKYGDYFLWEQLCSHAEKQEAHAIFVTNDFKEDWWHKDGQDILAPRYELREEFNLKSQKEILILTQEEFSNVANEVVEEKIDSDEMNKLKSGINISLKRKKPIKTQKIAQLKDYTDIESLLSKHSKEYPYLYQYIMNNSNENYEKNVAKKWLDIVKNFNNSNESLDTFIIRHGIMDMLPDKEED
ncbi:PIN domain-containing protein [Maridesulfovibrio sp.]|uniref:PIN domain-containing protein n=1 Tax=Maridesulfovibrio sp. TaxID=2795000 RepID=UPI0029C9DEFD|nr:PIN domain-containing protein [Maridesulfovibrio sp.]